MNEYLMNLVKQLKLFGKIYIDGLNPHESRLLKKALKEECIKYYEDISDSSLKKVN